MATVLLIEDDPDIRETLTEILHGERYSVLTASNGQEGLSVLSSIRVLPEVILLDLRMPVMDGREFRIHLRVHPTWGHIPVVVYSGTPDFCPPGDLEPLAANLLKPVEIPVLLEVIRNCCRGTEPPGFDPEDEGCELGDLELLAA